MILAMGEYNHLEVLRETDFSYILGEPEQEVFLHKKQVVGDIEVGERIEVFLYFDNQKRITATMRKPLVDQDNPAFLEVIDVNYHLGVFLNVGLIKDLLLSRDDLSFVRNEWPRKGDKIFVKMKASRNQLSAKIIPRYSISKYLKPEEELVEGEKYLAYNVYKTEEGNVFFTEKGHYIFVYFKHMRKVYRLGEQAEVKIIIVKGGFDYNGTLIMQKELMMSEDALRIKEYLEKHNGEMSFTDKSSVEDIEEVFHMSKSAFKRALGVLYKSKAVLLEKDKTVIVKDVEN
jgi:predicted RNA-binding protein (virulence factor B family)